MPYTDHDLPFSGVTPISRFCSHQGAEDAKQRALPQTIRYLTALKDHPEGLTDAESAALLNLERTSITGRRVPLVKAGLVVAAGTRMGPTGKVKNTVWKLL